MTQDAHLQGWELTGEDGVRFFLYVNGAVLLTESLVLMGLRYQKSLQKADAGGPAPAEQLQLGMDSAQARRLAGLLLEAADRLEGVPSSKPIAW